MQYNAIHSEILATFIYKQYMLSFVGTLTDRFMSTSAFYKANTKQQIKHKKQYKYINQNTIQKTI